MNYFKDKLLKERKEVEGLIHQMKTNETFNTDIEFAAEISELSVYDNHPSDTASELYDEERGRALKEHEITIIEKIDAALNDISNGSYGKCRSCGKEISESRLEFIPYAEFCVECQTRDSSIKPREKNNRPVEEEVLSRPFGYGFTDFDEEEPIEYDAEDSYQDVQRYDYRKNVDYEFLEDDDFVEPIERISNDQYRNQLPD